MKSHYILLSILITILMVSFMGAVMRNGSGTFADDRLKAPDFPKGVSWINTERPLEMKELRGRAVLLDFWTYCCINCMHVLPDLEKLEDKYGDRLVVVGVHSAKFEGEKDTDNIRNAVLRYGIRHPVVNDAGFTLWKQLGVRAWPTLALIDTEGYIAGQVSGEGNYDALDRAIGSILEKSGVTAVLPSLPVSYGDDNRGTTELYYPGKVVAAPDGQHLYVADSGNNRILVVDPGSGDILETIGSGVKGLTDGKYDEAAFRNPQGMAFADDILYVADTGNHALRAVDLGTHKVRTVTGDGMQARFRAAGGGAGSARLNSPWDIVYLDGMLYIAMAGPHQLWFYDPEARRVGVYAGSGREDIIDGALPNAALAQPSGITTDGRDIYFADSETSSIRKADRAAGRIVTLAGTGLFDFGHRDGPLRRALLQHPLGIAWGGGSLWVADTYNNRIRRIDPVESTISTVAGGDEDGLADGPGLTARFDEPGGLAYHDGRLYVADTNNHAIRVVDTKTGVVSTLDVKAVVRLTADDRQFRIRIDAPEGFHINEEAPNEIRASAESTGQKLDVSPPATSPRAVDAVVKADGITDGITVTITGDIYLCGDGDNTVCYPGTFTTKRIVRMADARDGAGVVSLTAESPVVRN